MAYDKAYEPVGWENRPARDTLVSKKNLGKMDDGINMLAERVVEMSGKEDDLEERLETVETEVTPIERGGTGAKTAKAAEYNLIGGMAETTAALTDEAQAVFKYTSPSSTQGVLLYQKVGLFWDYIKSKISSGLGLTAETYKGNATTATTASKLSNTSAIGSDTKPVYFNSGGVPAEGKYTLGDACAKGVADSTAASAIGTGTNLVTERDVYYGLPNINGSHGYNSSSKIYAPISAGTYGQVLKSFGADAPQWVDQNTIEAGSATKATQDADGNVITNTYATKTENGKKYDSEIPRTANTVLAGPNGSAGPGTFRKLVANDLPTVPATKGGTGKTTLVDSANALINALTTGSSVPTDNDYFVSQYASGGTTITTFHRRPVSALWNYIKSKADSVYATLTHSHSNATTSASGFMSSTDKATLNRLDRESLSLVPRGTSIGSSKNLNTTEFLKVGKYYCSADATVATLTNCPTKNAFMMEVYSPLSTAYDNEATAQYVYRVRKLMTYGGAEYIQSVHSSSTAGTFTYGTWRRTDSDTVYTHPASGVTAGTYRSVTVDKNGHVTGGTNPTMTIAQGGTGATTAKGAEYNVLAGMVESATDPTDESLFAFRYTSPSATQGTLYWRKASYVWNYIKGKISSVLGLTATSYGGNAATATKAAQDGNGKNIASTYATKDELANVESGNSSSFLTKANPAGTGSLSLNRASGSTVGDRSVALGYECTASGQFAFAKGYYSTASGVCSHADGHRCTASVDYSHAEGSYATASGMYSHAEGRNTTALQGQHAQGHYNDTSLATANTYSGTSSGTAFVVGNGTADAVSNAFRVTGAGKTYAKASYNSTGADYAEFAEWADGNPDNEDRRGYFVTFDEDKPHMIRKANAGEYILGIISGNPCVIGNSDEGWVNKYVFDEFGAFVYEEQEAEIEYVNDETGETEIRTEMIMTYKLNPDYDPAQTYVHRDERPEWDYVGWIGVLSVYDDGTCVPGSYCAVADGGIATAAERGTDTYRVLSRVNDNIIKVALK